jgi:hypothetical protein
MSNEAPTQSITIKPSLRPYRNLCLNDAERFIPDHNLLMSWLALRRWSSVLFSGADGRAQDAFWNKHGEKAFYARINKVRRACGYCPIENAC